jgi:hypothetical protein
VLVEAPAQTGETGALPVIGLAHPGGTLPSSVVDRLRALRPGFLHLLVDLGDGDWASDLAADLRLAAELDAGVVVTVDCPPDRHRELHALGELGGGSIDTAFLFGPGQAVTSPGLAEAGRACLLGTGARVGAGTRGHFASLNIAGHVPDAAEVVAVALAAAAHDDDRRALTTGLDSYRPILRRVSQIAGDRELYVGPVGFAPTFDSWSGPRSGLKPRDAWAGGHPRQSSVFGAAWTIAAIAALVPHGARRVCLGGTVGGGGVGAVVNGEFRAYPVFRALRLLADIGPGPLGVVRSGDRLVGLSGDKMTVVAVMTDGPVGFTPWAGPVTVWSGTALGAIRPGTVGADGEVPSPSIVVARPADGPGPLEREELRG